MKRVVCMLFKGKFNVQLIQKRIKCAGFVFVELELGFQLLPCAHFVQFFFLHFVCMFEDFRNYLVLIPSAKWISFSIVTHWHGFLKLSLYTVLTPSYHRLRTKNTFEIAICTKRAHINFFIENWPKIDCTKPDLIWFDLICSTTITEDAKYVSANRRHPLITERKKIVADGIVLIWRKQHWLAIHTRTNFNRKSIINRIGWFNGI